MRARINLVLGSPAQGQAPPSEVGQRRLTDQCGEPADEGGTGQPRVPTQFGDGPRSTRFVVEGAQRRGDSRIVQGSDPAGGVAGGLLVEPRAQDVRERQVQQSGQHRIRARATLFQFYVEQIQCRT